MALELNGQNGIAWARPKGAPDGFETETVLFGRNENSALSAIELAVARYTKPGVPNRESLARLHKLRLNGRVAALVLVIGLKDGSVLTFGPNADSAPLGPLDAEQAQRILQAVLDEPSQSAARTRLAGLAQAIDSTTIPGVKNSGLFANQELRVGVPARADWSDACATSAPLLSARGDELVKKLGFTIGQSGAHALVLTGTGPRPQAIAVMLDEKEAFDANSQRFTVSPVAYGLGMAEREGVPWLIILRGTQVRLYPARIDLGVGRKGLAETFCEVDLPQLTLENAGYLSLIFSASALEEGGAAHQIMKASALFAVALGERLREKVYDDIIPALALAVAAQLQGQKYEMDAEGLDLAYQLTLRIFFRLLFQVYAEDRRLLPFGENAKYDRNALKTVALDLVEDPDQEFDANSTSLWDDLAQVWRVIDSGDRAWGVPAYNGGLFTTDAEYNPHGAIISSIRIDNSVMGPILKALLLDDGDDGTAGPIDFRSLSVREFGTIYEGLLESSLGMAEVDLTLDEKQTWVPAKKGDEIWATAGQVYFHNTSGQRKGTGSYFTPSFVVEHLLERSLDPALDEHLEKVAELAKAGNQAAAHELFFDFRVADLAMGSGHFLTSAIDHIEAKMAAFLADEDIQIPGVAKELKLLAAAAKEKAGPDSPDPEPSSLLRRQIARRCIYGLDINPIAVELARVSIWIHTFVRGLPMSSLDHNLVCANSLTGIGNIDEALDVLVPDRAGGAMTLFDDPIKDALGSARTVLVDVANMLELDRDESRAASKAVAKAQKVAEKAKLLFDAAVLTRIGRGNLVLAFDPDSIAKLAAEPQAQEVLAPLRPAHMPVLFPEVFLRENGGFDVLVGNPPWEKLHVEEQQWWGLRMPGLRSMPMAQRAKELAVFRAARSELEAEFLSDIEASNAARAVIAAGPYPGIGSGHIDLYKAFAWRNWHLCRHRGVIGEVLPRGALSGSGTEQWRRCVLEQGEFADVVIGTNTRGWMFQSVHQQYSVGLICIRREPGREIVRFAGPFHSMAEFDAGRRNLAEVTAHEFVTWTSSAAFPLLPSNAAAQVFRELRRSGRLEEDSNFSLRPVQGDINMTLQRSWFENVSPDSDRPVPILTGGSIGGWSPDFGPVYGSASSEIWERLLEKVSAASGNRRSAFFGMAIASRGDLPSARARIAFRWLTRATDTRTMIPCLVPPGVVLVEKAPFFVRRVGTERDEAYLLGVLSTRIFDWYVRRLVELSMTFEIVNYSPIPRVELDDSRYVRSVRIAGRLAARDDRFADWAAAVGVPVGSVSEEEQPDLEAELDALVAHLYGLSRDQVIHIFETFHRGWDYQPRLTKVLEFFDSIEVSA